MAFKGLPVLIFSFTSLQVFEKRIKQFVDSVEESQPNIRQLLAHQSVMQSGADLVTAELNDLNKQYMELQAELNYRLKQFKQVYENAGLYFPVSFVIE